MPTALLPTALLPTALLPGAVAAMLLVAGCVASAPQGTSSAPPSVAPGPRTSAAPSTASPPASTAGRSTPAATPALGAAAALLRTLAAKGRAPLTGYDRQLFGPAWTDATDAPLGHNGCDTRNDVLRRDLVSVTLKPDSHGCAVLAGRLDDPYTGAEIAFRRGVATSRLVQIDHVVALGDAWQTGAQRWSAATRAEFANDPLELLAVDGHSNESKGDGDAATWLPPDKSYRCAYVARQVAIKVRYRLWVTPAEHEALDRVLSRCPGQPAPTEHGSPTIATAGPAPTITSSARYTLGRSARSDQSCCDGASAAARSPATNPAW